MQQVVTNVLPLMIPPRPEVVAKTPSPSQSTAFQSLLEGALLQELGVMETQLKEPMTVMVPTGVATVPIPRPTESTVPAPIAPAEPMALPLQPQPPNLASLGAVLSPGLTEAEPALVEPETDKALPDGELSAMLVAQATTGLPVMIQPLLGPNTTPEVVADHLSFTPIQMLTPPNDPLLEALAGRAAAALQDPEASSPAVSNTESQGPVFQDLVRLLTDAEGAGEGRNQAQPMAPELELAQPSVVPSPRVIALKGEVPASVETVAPRETATVSVERVAMVPKAAKVQVQPSNLEAGHLELDKGTAPKDPQAPGSDHLESPAPLSSEKTARTEQPEPVREAQQDPQSRIDPEPVVRQVTRFLKVMLDGKRSELRMQLHPADLGTIAVKLILNEGVVRASITTQDNAVKAVLESNLEQLRTRLADQGLQVEQIHVTVGGGGQFGHPDQSQQGDRRQAAQQGRPAWSGNGDASPQLTQDQQPPETRTWSPKGTGSRINHLA